ncbi:DUF2061 domain-containing protein [Marinomonas pollencensis]|uniref:Putative membrane protein n=1 Tax=Marinomonas pollencensis TaxID=491954 RepID=A0A3E0DTT7_9GAMM|nr:DUF2061 domain-containing protein [Marinomonas pollencensis]REG86977.1 putative membrane protein [Marinomonas pollencensis]
MTKTITFAVMHFTIAFSVAYLLTGSFIVGGLVAIVEPAINTVAFYFHERFWAKLESAKKTTKFNSTWQAASESYALRGL